MKNEIKEREKLLIQLAEIGFQDKEIADKLNVEKVSAITSAFQYLRHKLGVHNRMELVRTAKNLGLI